MEEVSAHMRSVAADQRGEMIFHIFVVVASFFFFLKTGMILVSFEECFDVDANSIYIVSLSVVSLSICLEIGEKKCVKGKTSSENQLHI